LNGITYSSKNFIDEIVVSCCFAIRLAEEQDASNKIKERENKAILRDTLFKPVCLGGKNMEFG